MTAVFGITASIPTPAVGGESASKSPLKCDFGPVVKAYGMTQWLVYSCNDRRTVVIVSGPKNPATPFYFMLYPTENGYKIHGEGTGSQDATAAAFKELELLSEIEIAALIEQTLHTGN